MKEQSKITQYLLNAENSHQIRVRETIVEMEYSDNHRTFKECMLTILKQKIGK